MGYFDKQYNELLIEYWQLVQTKKDIENLIERTDISYATKGALMREIEGLNIMIEKSSKDCTKQKEKEIKKFWDSRTLNEKRKLKYKKLENDHSKHDHPKNLPIGFSLDTDSPDDEYKAILIDENPNGPYAEEKRLSEQNKQ